MSRSRRYDFFMNLKFAVSLGSALLVLKFSAQALDPEKQSVIDRYKQPFAVYLMAINDLGSALETVSTEPDLIKAADKFCDQANKFVWLVDDQNKIRYRQVKIGTLHDGFRVVTEGLTPADRVVIHGIQRARPDITVQVEEQPLTLPADDGKPPNEAG